MGIQKRGKKEHALTPQAGRFVKVGERRLTQEQFYGLSKVPPEVEWFANIQNPQTRRAYEIDVRDFMTYAGIVKPEEFRLVTRPHIIAWRKSLVERGLAASTIRRKLSALSSLFGHLTENNAVLINPVNGVKRPGEAANEGKTPALGDDQARALLEAPSPKTLKGKRDGAILSVFLFHGLRCEELTKLKVRDIQPRRGVLHFRVHGKGSKIRYVPIHPGSLGRINEYLAAAGHVDDRPAPLFQPVKNNATGKTRKALSATAVLVNIVKHYAEKAGIDLEGFCTHALRATAATNALDNEADIAKVQEWLGHASISTTRLYDRRKTRPEDSPTFRVSY